MSFRLIVSYIPNLEDLINFMDLNIDAKTLDALLSLAKDVKVQKLNEAKAKIDVELSTIDVIK